MTACAFKQVSGALTIRPGIAGGIELLHFLQSWPEMETLGRPPSPLWTKIISLSSGTISCASIVPRGARLRESEAHPFEHATQRRSIGCGTNRTIATTKSQSHSVIESPASGLLSEDNDACVIYAVRQYRFAWMPRLALI